MKELNVRLAAWDTVYHEAGGDNARDMNRSPITTMLENRLFLRFYGTTFSTTRLSVVRSERIEGYASRMSQYKSNLEPYTTDVDFGENRRTEKKKKVWGEDRCTNLTTCCRSLAVNYPQRERFLRFSALPGGAVRCGGVRRGGVWVSTCRLPLTLTPHTPSLYCPAWRRERKTRTKRKR